MNEELSPCEFDSEEVKRLKSIIVGYQKELELYKSIINDRSEPKYKYETFKDFKKSHNHWTISTIGERMSFDAARELKGE